MHAVLLCSYQWYAIDTEDAGCIAAVHDHHEEQEGSDFGFAW